MKLVYFVAFLFLITLCFFLPTASVYAQSPTPFDVTASPQFFDITANPGDVIKKQFRLRNNTSQTLPFTITVKKLIPTNTGDGTIVDGTAKDTYLSWLTIDTGENVTVNSREWTDINLTIHIPKEAAFGYYYSLYITPKNGIGLKNQNGTAITGAIGIPFLLNVNSPGAVVSGKFLSFLTSQSWYEYPPVTFLTKFMNTGNVHIKPHGTIFISDWTGKTISTLDINDASSNVLPHSSRIFESNWTDAFITEIDKTEDGKVMTDKNGKPQKKLVIKFDKLLDLRIGKYTAHALLVISDSKRDIPFEATTTFWVFPWKIVLGSIVFIILAGIGLWNTLHGIWNKLSRLFNKNSKL